MFLGIKKVVSKIKSAIKNGRRSLRETSAAQIRTTVLKNGKNYKRVYKDLGVDNLLEGVDQNSISCHDLETRLEKCFIDAIIDPPLRMRCAILSHLVESCHEGSDC